MNAKKTTIRFYVNGTCLDTLKEWHGLVVATVGQVKATVPVRRDDMWSMDIDLSDADRRALMRLWGKGWNRRVTYEEV